MSEEDYMKGHQEGYSTGYQKGHNDGFANALSQFVSCGERRIQKLFRIPLKDICERYKIKEGDAIEVFIRKTEHEASAEPK